MRVLITGASAPIALELARLLKQQGALVFAADSVSLPITRMSNSVSAYCKVASPRFRFEEFATQLHDLVQKHSIDLIVPTSEEIFYVLKAMEKRRIDCHVLGDSLQKSVNLHNKFTFQNMCRQQGLKRRSHLKFPSAKLMSL